MRRLYSFTSPHEWIFAPHVFGFGFPIADLTVDTDDERRRLSENGIMVTSIQGQVSGKTPNNIFTWKRYFTRNQILKHKADDPNVDVSVHDTVNAEDEVYFSMRCRPQNELNGSAITNSQATDMRFKIQISITQYSRYQRTGMTLLTT